MPSPEEQDRALPVLAGRVVGLELYVNAGRAVAAYRPVMLRDADLNCIEAGIDTVPNGAVLDGADVQDSSAPDLHRSLRLRQLDAGDGRQGATAVGI